MASTHEPRGRTCRDCGSEFVTTNRSTRCNPCTHARRRREAPPCACGAPKHPRAKRCPGCYHAEVRQGPTEVAAKLTESAQRTEEGCLIPAYGTRLRGYVRVRLGDGSMHLAHRIVVAEEHGPIPESVTVDHTCHNRAVALGTCAGGHSCRHRACIELSHLAPSEAVDNWRRGTEGAPAMHRAKTHCPAGHPYTGENLYVRPSTGARRCRTCHREREAERQRKKKRQRDGLDT
ncbi:HNH endonuclease [Streptomyces sp. TR02-1]|uniref:HNH endonuclease n=1 Tax=Streptomyces sp. TR02-1 TaxID=3385977 RepID=UPI0039A20E75